MPGKKKKGKGPRGTAFGFDKPFGTDSSAEEVPDGVDMFGDLGEGGATAIGEPNSAEEVTFEQASREDADQILSSFDEQNKKARERLKAGLDCDFFFCVTFLDSKQREAFLAASGWEKFGRRYVNGLALAKALGIELPESAYKPSEPKLDKAYAEFALDFDESRAGF